MDLLKSQKPKKKSNSKDATKSKKPVPDQSVKKKKGNEKKSLRSIRGVGKSGRSGRKDVKSGRSGRKDVKSGKSGRKDVKSGRTKSARQAISNKVKSVTSKRSKDQKQKSVKEKKPSGPPLTDTPMATNFFDPSTFTFKLESCINPEPTNHTPAQKQAFESFASSVLAIGVEGLVKEYVELLFPFIPPLERTIFDQNTELKKNRYKDVVCNDKTRVILNDGRPGDYIHANYVKGIKPLYILTQGPIKDSVMDMWRMVLQENVAAICMLCELVENGRPKCEAYFPDAEGQVLTFEDITVTCTEYTLPDLHTQLKALTVVDKKTGKTHKLNHYKIITWPDKTIPMSNLSVLRTHRLLRKLTGPVVVHCSAGVGRTGTFAAIEIGAQCLLNGKNFKPVDLVKAIRHCRLHSVQMDTQYLMLVEALLDMGVAFKYIEEKKLLDAIEVYKKHTAEYVEAHPPPKEMFKSPGKKEKEKEKENEDHPPIEPVNPDPTHTLYPIQSSPIGPPPGAPPPTTPIAPVTPVKVAPSPATAKSPNPVPTQAATPTTPKPAIQPAPAPIQSFGNSMHVSILQQPPPPNLNPGNSQYL